MPSFSADNMNPREYEQLINYDDVVSIQLIAGNPIEIVKGSYSERKLDIPDEHGRGSKIEMFRATCPDGRVVIGKTQSIVGMWMSFPD